MKIKEERDGNVLTYIIKGNLDTTTAPMLEERLNAVAEDVTEIVFDFADVNFISSAGLRTLLIADRVVGENGVIKVKDANEMVQDVFYSTGFSDVLQLI